MTFFQLPIKIAFFRVSSKKKRPALTGPASLSSVTENYFRK
jgi:hypothetical protein